MDNDTAPAQSQLDALREEVARLTKEREEWKAMAEHNFYRRMASLGERNAAQAELAALKAQPSDVDALMALADAYAEEAWAQARGGDKSTEVAAREALRAKLAARKEEL